MKGFKASIRECNLNKRISSSIPFIEVYPELDAWLKHCPSNVASATTTIFIAFSLTWKLRQHLTGHESAPFKWPPGEHSKRNPANYHHPKDRRTPGCKWWLAQCGHLRREMQFPTGKRMSISSLYRSIQTSWRNVLGNILLGQLK